MDGASNASGKIKRKKEGDADESSSKSALEASDVNSLPPASGPASNPVDEGVSVETIKAMQTKMDAMMTSLGTLQKSIPSADASNQAAATPLSNGLTNQRLPLAVVTVNRHALDDHKQHHGGNHGEATSYEDCIRDHQYQPEFGRKRHLEQQDRITVPQYRRGEHDGSENSMSRRNQTGERSDYQRTRDNDENQYMHDRDDYQYTRDRGDSRRTRDNDEKQQMHDRDDYHYTRDHGDVQYTRGREDNQYKQHRQQQHDNRLPRNVQY